eukprot:scaffold262513_cov32-Tisochrysis_lutea.AAC.3
MRVECGQRAAPEGRIHGRVSERVEREVCLVLVGETIEVETAEEGGEGKRAHHGREQRRWR